MATQSWTTSRVLPTSKEAVERASTSVNPTITQITQDTEAEYMVYVIHGLESNISTWGPFDHTGDKPFRWLNNLSDWLKTNGGQAVDVSLVGWNTSRNAANISTEIRDAAKSLANKIVTRQENFGFTQLGPAKQPQQQHKVILMGHSMGGILARALLAYMHGELQDGYSAKTAPYTNFLRSIHGVILLASPSSGSSLATFASPLYAGIGGLTGGLSVLFNNVFLKALKPASPELRSITASFDKFCEWYENGTRTKLKMAALRETAKVKGIVMIVKPESADVPESTKALVDSQTDDLQGLDHVQVTHFDRMDDPNLLKILWQVRRLQG